MIAELHCSLSHPVVLDGVTRVVIRDKIDGVISLVMEVGPRHYFTVHRGDGDVAMNRALRAMGINETVISDMVTDLPKPQGKLFIPEEQAPDDTNDTGSTSS
jgi:hypothetical protein